MLAGLATVAPPGEAGTAAPADPADVAAWTAALDEAGAALSATGTGSDDHTLTRAGLLASVTLLRSAVDAASVADPASAAAPAAAEALARDRDEAVVLWEAAAARLDTLVLAGGGEHVHLFLAPDGDPDAVPEEFREHPED